MSITATFLCSLASMIADNLADSTATVGLDTPSLFIHSLCLLPSATVLPLILPSLFSVMKKSELTEFMACPFYLSVSLFTSSGLKQDLSCNCFISVTPACLPFSPCFFICCYNCMFEQMLFEMSLLALGPHCSHASMCLLGTLE